MPPQGPSLGPSRPVHTPSPPHSPTLGDLESGPDWGSGTGESHVSDDGADWGSHPLMSDTNWGTRQRSADDGPDWAGPPLHGRRGLVIGAAEGLFVSPPVFAALIGLYPLNN
jgi:hypothetical protein